MSKEETKKDALVEKEEQDIFARFDELDEKIILAEMENRATGIMVYHFPMEGHDIWGISKSGVDACVERLGKQGIAIRETEVDIRVDPTDPSYVLITAKVQKVLVDNEGREAKVESFIGTKRQYTFIKSRKTGMLIQNKFWYEQGTMKALRNAKLRMIPEDIKVKVIEYAKTKKKVQKVDYNDRKKTQQTQRKEAVKEEESNRGFPDEQTQAQSTNSLTQDQNMKLIRYTATLVDRWNYDPYQILAKLDEMFGSHDYSKYSSELAERVISFFEDTIKLNENRNPA